ncbi:MAG: outer membrane protein assembly factor BamA, partial [Elusimicrobia bacterium RIFCSPHIGHO2_01_FULL_64_10]
MKHFSRIFCFVFCAVLTGEWFPAARPARAEAPKPKIIREIRIEGAKNFKQRAVRDLIKTRPRDFFSEGALREDIQFILGSGNYEDAEVRTEDVAGGVRVIYSVKEKPVVRKVDFTGNSKIRDGRLAGEISLKKKEGYDAVKLRADVQTILSQYGEKGYADAKVEPFTTFDDAADQVSINFVIKEGKRVLIERVEFAGNAAFSTRKLRRLIKTKKRKVYNSEQISEDRKEIEKFYKNNGYAQVKTTDTVTAYNADRTRITLTFPIEEGPSFVVGDFTFRGNSVYSNEELMKAVRLKPGRRSNEEKFEETLQNLRELYLDKGYLYSRIEPEQDPDPKAGLIHYKFYIDEGGIVYIDRIFVEGNKKTKEKVFRREILLKPGDPFSSSKLRRSQEKIFNLGFIDDVKPDIQP